MRTSKNIMGIRNDRTKVALQGVALQLRVSCSPSSRWQSVPPRPSYARVSSSPPVSQCSDFACEQ
jgi:hypothetical protein